MYTIKTIDDPRTLNKTLYLRPPQNILSQREVVEIWEKLIGKQLQKSSIFKEEFLTNMKSKYYLFFVCIYTIFLTQNIAWFINSSINCFSSDPNSPKLCSAGGINTLLSCFLWWMSCKLWDRRWSRGSFSALPWNQVYYSPWIHERSQPCIELMLLRYFSVLAKGFSIFNVRLCSICI